MIHTLDLQFLGIDQAIACFLIETTVGPILIETGPHSTFPAMKLELGKFGYKPEDIRYVLLTHIHFDHAGAAWAFAKTGATIYVHPFGAAHLAEPEKLYNSAKMIYGEDMERLWGNMERINPEQIKSVQHLEDIQIGDKTFKALHTPGHAKHHIAWQFDDIIFTGDVAGVKIGSGPVVPPCPPPDISLEDWKESIYLLINSGAKKLMLTHYGQITAIDVHLSQLQLILDDWANWILTKWQQGLTPEEITPLFTEYTSGQLRDLGVYDHGITQYEAANPSWMSVAGLIRYWKKKSG